MKSRKVRRQEARKNKTDFSPKYNGAAPVTFQEFYGVGYERFNTKLVTIR